MINKKPKSKNQKMIKINEAKTPESNLCFVVEEHFLQPFLKNLNERMGLSIRVSLIFPNFPLTFSLRASEKLLIFQYTEEDDPFLKLQNRRFCSNGRIFFSK